MSLRPGDKVGLAAVVLGAAAGLVLLLRCQPGEDVRWNRAPTFASPAEAELHDLLVAAFGSVEAPRAPAGFGAAGLPAPGDEGDARLRLGRGTWSTQCMHCHGSEGGAETSTAALLHPRPRDFGLGILKFTSTVAGAPPARADIERTVREGLPYTAMSAFAKLPGPALPCVVDYTLWMLLRGAVWRDARERLGAGAAPAAAFTAAVAAVAHAWDPEQARVLAVPAAPPDTPAARARGAALFDGAAGCAACHGADGGGRGPSTWDAGAQHWLLADAWGLPAQPRDLRAGQYHGGNRAEDLYRRIHAGVKGTPMPAHGERLTPEQIWDLVAHLRALAGQ